MQIDSDGDYEDTDSHHIKSYTNKLPTIAQLISQTKLQQTLEGDNEQLTKSERIAKKGEYAKIVLNSPSDPRNHSVEKERIHKTREIAKTLFGYYETPMGNPLYIDKKDLLRGTIKHIKRQHIEAFYKTVNGKFIIVSKKDEYKELYSQ